MFVAQTRAYSVELLFCIAAILFGTMAQEARSQITGSMPGIQITTIASGVYIPTRMAFAPDGQLYVCNQTGSVFRLSSTGLVQVVAIRVTQLGESGLLGLTFHPGFLTNGFFYVYYTTPGGDPHNRVSRLQVSSGAVSTNSEAILLELDSSPFFYYHNAGAIEFGLDGKLYVAVGDNHSGPSQILTNLLGKILRINDDGSIPLDNPFFNSTSGNSRAIWAIGLRNPFSLAFHRGTGRCLINDVGDLMWEEINEGEAGANYGWPYSEGPTTTPGISSPLHAYGHGISETGACSIVAGAFCDSAVAKFPLSFRDNYFFADFCAGWVKCLQSDGTTTNVVTGFRYPVDLKMGPDGSLYCLTRSGLIDVGPGSSWGGDIYRIAYKSTVQITKVRKTASVFEIESTAVPGQIYILQSSADLAIWTSLSTNTATSTNVSFVRSVSTNDAKRFYRLAE